MYHLIYVGSASKPFSQLELDDLVTKARQNNIRLGITGMLIYKDGNFIQLLEGEEDVVKKLYETIRTDTRLNETTVINESEVAERQFSDWVMNLLTYNNKPLFTAAELENDKIGTLKMLNDYVDYMR
jgi:Sensors of blue-light using FAD.